MANTILTPLQITREALRVLHQKLNFIGSINREYDASFGQSGAQIGSVLRIRLPNQYVMRRGTVMSEQDTQENSTSLNVNNMWGCDLNFTDADLALSLQDFSQRILNPAVAVIASGIESDAINAMVLDIYNQVNGHGTAQTFRNFLLARKMLRDNLAPQDDQLYVRMCTQDNVDLVDALKGLFQDSKAVASQYRDGVLGRTAGFEFAENTLLNSYTRGAGNTAYTVNGAGQTGSTLVVQSGSGAVNQGDVFTLQGVYRVHPETKLSTGVLQQFVATAPMLSGGTSLSFSPAIVTSGGTQNVSVSPNSGATITWAGTISTASGLSLAYHKDAFTFATADLVMPRGCDMAAREVFDGISMRLVRQFDIKNGKFPVRLDVLGGFKTIRPQLAVRCAAN